MSTPTTPEALPPKSGSAPLRFRQPDDMILTEKDIKLCLGSGELLRCPFCGESAMSIGENIEGRAGKAVRWTIQCTGMKGLMPSCFASVLAVDPDQETARLTAVSRWNRRVQNAE